MSMRTCHALALALASALACDETAEDAPSLSSVPYVFPRAAEYEVTGYTLTPKDFASGLLACAEEEKVSGPVTISWHPATASEEVVGVGMSAMSKGAWRECMIKHFAPFVP